VETILASHRALAESVRRLRRALDTRCGEILRDGGLRADSSESSLYALDIEVLRDEGTGLRLWDHYYDREIRKEASFFSGESVLAQLNKAFDPEDGPDGKPTQPAPEKIAQRIVDDLVKSSRDVLHDRIVGAESLSDDRGALGLLIDDALRIEAGIVLSRHRKEAPEADAIDIYIKDKLRHARAKAELLCAFQPPAPDRHVEPINPMLLCAHPVYSQSSLLAQLAPAQVGGQWDDPKTLLIYQAYLGVPLYWIRALNQRMKQAYHEVREDYVKRKRYPLHIDRNWEESLADLDPEVDAGVRRQLEADEPHLAYFFSRIANVVVERDKQLHVVLQIGATTIDRPLGATDVEAYAALTANADLMAPIRARLKSIREYLEGPTEPPEAWSDVITRFEQLYAAAATNAANTFAMQQRDAIGRYARRFAPPKVVSQLEERGLLPKG
jgi:hypothetical protein